MLSETVLAGLVRAAATVVAALVALPLVAWLEGLRGRASTAGGPGPRGAATAIATAIKLLEKRAPRTAGADRLVHTAAPLLALIPTLAVPAVIPLSPHDPVASTLPFALALPLLSTGAVALAGYAGGSRLAHLAGLRLVALRLSVLVVVAASATAAAHATGAVDLPSIVAAQARPLVGFVPRWTLLLAPTSFLAALVALAIHAQHVLRARTEPSLAEPWLGDATGPVLLGHRVFESLDLVAGACLLAVTFLGGWHIPGVEAAPTVATLLKVLLALVAILVVRNNLPSLTHAVSLRVCWIVLLPLAVGGTVLLELFT